MNDVVVYERIGKGTGLIGKWRSGKLDGAEFKPTGPTIPPGTTVSMKAASPSKISYVWRLNGKPDGYGVQTVAADGKSFTDVSWNPGKEAEKSTAYYVKQ